MACLILGDGKLATELVKQTGWDYISRKKDNFDFTDINSYKHMLLSYDIIINCIGQTQTYSTERQLNWDINYVGVIHLVNYCNEKSIKLIHISTDYIYANAKNNQQYKQVDDSKKYDGSGDDKKNNNWIYWALGIGGGLFAIGKATKVI